LAKNAAPFVETGTAPRKRLECQNKYSDIEVKLSERGFANYGTQLWYGWVARNLYA